MKIALATKNDHKIAEIREILDGLNVESVSQKDIAPDLFVEEDGFSFEENALKKARALCLVSNLPTISDDSGIEVDFLDGEPGIFSARFAGVSASDEDNNNLLLKKMAGVKNVDRGAQYYCCVALVYPRSQELIFTGICRGLINVKSAQPGGFGYDPLFYYTDLKKSFSELSSVEKHKVSHRGVALAKLREYLIHR